MQAILFSFSVSPAQIPSTEEKKDANKHELLTVEQQGPASEGAKRVYLWDRLKGVDAPVDPQQLFIIPTADVLKSMAVSTGAGSAFGVQQNEKSPFLRHVRFGLGNTAEIELSSIGVINNLSQGAASIPTAAFKLKILPEIGGRPGLAAALRSSLWHSERRNKWVFEKRLATLYFVATKTFGPATLNLGMSVEDLRIRSKYAGTEQIYSPASAPGEKRDKDYINRNLLAPFLGLKVWVNDRTRLMFEIEKIAKYDFDENLPELSVSDITSEWMTIAGVRFFFLNWLALDTGVLYRSDFHGIGDAQINAGFHVNFSLIKRRV